MGKTFREWNPEQRLLLPPSVEEFVPAGDVAHFVRDLVQESPDLSAITDAYREERGFPPYHPVMMSALLRYAYCDAGPDQGPYGAPSRGGLGGCRLLFGAEFARGAPAPPQRLHRHRPAGAWAGTRQRGSPASPGPVHRRDVA
jgi:hypothetical protein